MTEPQEVENQQDKLEITDIANNKYLFHKFNGRVKGDQSVMVVRLGQN